MIIGKVTKNLPDTVEGMPVNGAVGGVAVVVGRMVHSEKKMNA